MLDLIKNIFFTIVDYEYARIGGAHHSYGDVEAYTIVLLVIVALLVVSLIMMLYYHGQKVQKRRDKEAFEKRTHYGHVGAVECENLEEMFKDLPRV